MIIDCGSCAHSPELHAAGTPEHATAVAACGDCVVSVLLGVPESLSPVTHLDDEHQAAIRVLAGSGLVPPLRLVERSQAS